MDCWEETCGVCCFGFNIDVSVRAFSAVFGNCQIHSDHRMLMKWFPFENSLQSYKISYL